MKRARILGRASSPVRTTSASRSTKTRPYRPSSMHHIHLFVTDPLAAQKWYIENFGATAGKRGQYDTANIPGAEITFTKSDTAQARRKAVRWITSALRCGTSMPSSANCKRQGSKPTPRSAIAPTRLACGSSTSPIPGGHKSRSRKAWLHRHQRRAAKTVRSLGRGSACESILRHHVIFFASSKGQSGFQLITSFAG